MYKIGDKLKCIKNVTFNHDKSNKIWIYNPVNDIFIKNNKYTIQKVLKQDNEISYKINNIWFIVNVKYNKNYKKNLVDYFETKKLERKLKILKINNITNEI